MCETKPNLGRMGYLGDGASGRPIMRHRLDAPLRETKPIPRLRISDCGLPIGDHPAAGRLPSGLPPRTRAGPLCKTKPIWSGLGKVGAPTDERRETNPVCRRPRWLGPGPFVQNEANFAGRSAPRRAKCAKRTQFAAGRPDVSEPIVQNEAKLGRDRVSGQRSILYEGTFAGKWNAQNEPNFQPTGYPTIPVFQRSNPMPIVQNEPNSRQRRMGRGASAQNEPNLAGRPEGRRQNCAKRTQFPSRTQNDMCFGRKELWRLRPLKALGDNASLPGVVPATKPIARGGAPRWCPPCRANEGPLFALLIRRQVVGCAGRLRRQHLYPYIHGWS
jgi:hypothetical protein